MLSGSVKVPSLIPSPAATTAAPANLQRQGFQNSLTPQTQHHLQRCMCQYIKNELLYNAELEATSCNVEVLGFPSLQAHWEESSSVADLRGWTIESHRTATAAATAASPAASPAPGGPPSAPSSARGSVACHHLCRRHPDVIRMAQSTISKCWHSAVN